MSTAAVQAPFGPERHAILAVDRDRGHSDATGLSTSAERMPTIEELYRMHAPSVARWAARLGGPSADVEDVLQDVFVIAHRQLATFRGESQVSTWLFGITHNVVRSRRQRERVRRFFLSSFSTSVVRATPHAPQALHIEHQESLALVYQALSGLPDAHRTAFILFEIEGLSGEEAAALTGMKISTLRVNLMRARAHFSRRVERLMRGQG